MVLHPNLKKIIIFSSYAILLSAIHYTLDVDLEYIKLENKKHYSEIIKLEQSYQKKVNLSDSLISLNNASKDELMLLPNIGPKTANLILEYRQLNRFKKIEDILKIKGIGKKRFIKLKKHLKL